MCGIAGILNARGLSGAEIQNDLPAMAAALLHRGPDTGGVWADAEAGIGLAHRRLSIIDLSPLGAQPMSSASGRYTVVYNGEMYNFPELRAELRARGSQFRGESDTEVLLAAMDAWGVAAAVERCSGMFAFAVWDRDARTLHLARDRFGEKPLYYGQFGDVLLFGSELKALRVHAQWRDEIDREALALLMQRDFISSPHCIFKDVHKLEPGSILTITPRAQRLQFSHQRYWRPEELFEEGAREASTATFAETLDTLDALLARAVQRQMLADVPLGAFLSGGTDSSLVVALMQEASRRPVKTFTIGFNERAYDEAPYARAVAAHLGTDHTEMIVTQRDLLNVVPKLPAIYDEPFADASQIPTFLVCQLARSAVTVALSGDGGDELFGGYGRYASTLARWRVLQRVPSMVRLGGSALMEHLPAAAIELAARPVAKLWGRGAAFAGGLQDQALRWRAQSLRDFYRYGVQRWPPSGGVVLGMQGNTHVHDSDRRPRNVDELKQMMHMDTCEYLPDDILVKVDRAAMAVSLETRVPLLDPDVARAAWRIPSQLLMHDGRGKSVLRALLRRRVPPELIDRPKRGFAAPIAEWLRTDLKGWASDLLDPAKLRQDGFLDATVVQRRWRHHVSGRSNWAQHLWNVLAFQAWHEHWRGARTESRLQVG